MKCLGIVLFSFAFLFVSAKDSFRSLADSLYASAKYSELLSLDVSGIRNENTRAHVLYKQGLAQLAQNNPTVAAALLEKSLLDNPSNNEVFYYRSYALYLNEEYAKAADDLLILLERDSSYIDAWITLGICWMYEKKYQESGIAFDRAITLNSDVSLSWYNYGVLYSEMNKLDSSVVCFEKSLALDSTFHFSWSALGNSQYRLKNFEIAISAFKKAIYFGANDPSVYFWLGQSQRELGKYDEALESLIKCMDYDSCYQGVHLARAEIFYNRNLYREGITACDMSISCDADIAVAHKVRGMCNAKLGNTREALSDWEKSNEIKQGTVSKKEMQGLKVQDFLIQRGLYLLIISILLLVLLVYVVFLIIRRKN